MRMQRQKADMGLPSKARVGAPPCYPRRSFGKLQPEGQVTLVGEALDQQDMSKMGVAPEEIKNLEMELIIGK